MVDNTKDKTLMVRYLLGQVSAEERHGLEERYFADTDLFEELVGTENDLIDAYVRGQLSSAQRFQFESRFLATPELRDRVRAARSLAGYDSDLSGKSPGLWKLSSRSAIGPALRFVFSGVVVALLVWASWATVSNFRLRRQIEQANIEHARLLQQQQEAQRQIAELNARVQSQENNQTQELLPPGQTGQPIISLMLAPGVSRSGSKSTVLPLSSGVSGAMLLLKARPDPYSSYSVSLETPEGRQVLKRNGLKALSPGNAKVVQVFLPSSALQRGDYVLRLFGNNPGVQTEEIDAYSFRAVMH